VKVAAALPERRFAEGWRKAEVQEGGAAYSSENFPGGNRFSAQRRVWSFVLGLYLDDWGGFRSGRNPQLGYKRLAEP